MLETDYVTSPHVMLMVNHLKDGKVTLQEYNLFMSDMIYQNPGWNVALDYPSVEPAIFTYADGRIGKRLTRDGTFHSRLAGVILAITKIRAENKVRLRQIKWARDNFSEIGVKDKVDELERRIERFKPRGPTMKQVSLLLDCLKRDSQDMSNV